MKVISIEPTPNPDALKFFVNQPLSSSGVHHYESPKDAQDDQLAKALFALSGVLSVFYTGQFVTISKKAETDWKALEPKVVDLLQSEALNEVSAPVIKKKAGGPVTAADNELLKQINQILDENVRPALEGDGGGLEVMSLDGYVLTIHYQGACGSCPSSTQGTMVAVQNLLRAMVDPRIEVIAA